MFIFSHFFNAAVQLSSEKCKESAHVRLGCFYQSRTFTELFFLISIVGTEMWISYKKGRTFLLKMARSVRLSE